MRQPLKFSDNLFMLLLQVSIKHWQWFALLLFGGLAAWQVIVTPKTYRRTAAVMIRQETPMSYVQAAFSDRYAQSVSSENNVNNEIEAFKSPHLMYEVVLRMNIGTDYVRVDGFKRYDLYEHSPFKAIFSIPAKATPFHSIWKPLQTAFFDLQADVTQSENLMSVSRPSDDF
jgi:hypothetical protein